MKPFVMLKLPMLLCGLGAALILSPACKAQSEVAPDHFDGRDPWEIAYKNAAPKNHEKPAVALARNQKADAAPKLQMAAARDVSNPAPQDAVATQGKHKPAVRKPKKQ